jgi:hypothetical protein
LSLAGYGNTKKPLPEIKILAGKKQQSSFKHHFYCIPKTQKRKQEFLNIPTQIFNRTVLDPKWYCLSRTT